jgi:anaerobic selenocysteine-containing dehydrogenase
VDSFLTDTARLAHLVLPTTTLLEADDVLGAYGHHFLGVARPVVPPPPGVKSDLEIVQELAHRVGRAENGARGSKAPIETAVEGSARDWKKRIVEPKLAAHGVSLDTLERGAVRNPLVPKVLFADRRFPTASGRVNLIMEAPEERDDPDAGAFPLFLMALSTDKSQSSQWARPMKGPSVVTVHPDASQGIADGGVCRIESRLGSMVVRIHHDASQRRDVAIVPKGGHLRDGCCANKLIRARVTDMGEGGALYEERVRLLPLEEGS